MERIETVVEIGTPPARVWEVLTEFAKYAEWNPFITSIQGAPCEGETLEVSRAGDEISSESSSGGPAC